MRPTRSRRSPQAEPRRASRSGAHRRCLEPAPSPRWRPDRSPGTPPPSPPRGPAHRRGGQADRADHPDPALLGGARPDQPERLPGEGRAALLADRHGPGDPDPGPPGAAGVLAGRGAGGARHRGHRRPRPAPFRVPLGRPDPGPSSGASCSTRPSRPTTSSWPGWTTPWPGSVRSGTSGRPRPSGCGRPAERLDEGPTALIHPKPDGATTDDTGAAHSTAAMRCGRRRSRSPATAATRSRPTWPSRSTGLRPVGWW